MLLVLDGCASAPVHYYTLIPLNGASSDLAAAACCRVQVRPVLVPPEVDRPELVTRSGADQAIILTNETWLAPLRDEIRGALSNQINLKLREAAPVESVAGVQEAVVMVKVTRFESVPARYALVTANWRIQRADFPKATSLTCEATARIPIESGASALVEGYQQAVVKIADQIAVDLLDAGRDAAQRCAPAD